MMVASRASLSVVVQRKFRRFSIGINMLMIGLMVMIVFTSGSMLVSANVDELNKVKKKNVWIFTQPLFYDQVKPLVDKLISDEPSVAVTVLTPFDASED